MNTRFTTPLDDPEQLPSLPRLAEEIEDAVESPDSSFDDIASLIDNDETLSRRFIAFANSSFYEYPLTVTSVPDALSVIGLRNTKNMAIAFALPEHLSLPSSSSLDPDAFWRHSIAVGLCTRLLAHECREANTERHFLAGFFQKIGRPIIARSHPNTSEQILSRLKEEETLFQNLAIELLGFDDSEIAAATLQRWHFPTNLTTLVRYCNKPVLARYHLRGVSLLHIANFIVCSLNLGNAGDRFVPEFSEAAWGYAKFDESRLALVINELMRQYQNVCDAILLKA